MSDFFKEKNAYCHVIDYFCFIITLIPDHAE